MVGNRCRIPGLGYTRAFDSSTLRRRQRLWFFRGPHPLRGVAEHRAGQPLAMKADHFADVAHLVERDVANVEVVGSRPIIRSNLRKETVMSNPIQYVQVNLTRANGDGSRSSTTSWIPTKVKDRDKGGLVKIRKGLTIDLKNDDDTWTRDWIVAVCAV